MINFFENVSIKISDINSSPSPLRLNRHNPTGSQNDGAKPRERLTLDAIEKR